MPKSVKSNDKKVKGGRSRSPELTREKIIRASMKLIARNGYSETSFQIIADQCEISQSAVIHHFPTKKKLIESLGEEISKRNHSMVEKEFKPQDSALVRLQKHFLVNLKWSQQNKDEAKVVMLMSYLATTDEQFRRIYEERLKKARERISIYLYAGQREGIFRFEEPVAHLAELTHSMLAHSVFSLISAGERPSAKKISQKWNAFIEKIIIRS